MAETTLHDILAQFREEAMKHRDRRTMLGKILFINAVKEVTRECAQSFLADEYLQPVVRAYQDFKDEPGFTRTVTIEELRTKEGNRSIPLYVGRETQAQIEAASKSATTALPDALAGWPENSRKARESLQTLLTAPAK